MSKLRVYACGGAGVNIVHPMQKDLETKEGFSELSVLYVDTSMSNMHKKGIDKDLIYVFDGVDGSGKKRDSNYGVVTASVKEILLQHKPGDINVVVHSTSGGSGSVIGPVIASELLERGIPAIILSVGNRDCRAEIQNTINTIKSYDVIANKKKKPVVMSHYENNSTTPRAIVDKQIQASLNVVSAVFSGKNAELDSSDLVNFLDYTKLTSFAPGLARLEFYTQAITLEKGEVVASLVTLSKMGEDTSPGISVDYQAVGFISQEASQSISIQTPIHLATVLGYYPTLLKSLNDDLAAMDELRQSVNVKGLTDHNDANNATYDGLIL
jgi:hypothetical protein